MTRPGLSRGDLTAIAVGGALGARTRWLIAEWFDTADGVFPSPFGPATLAANLAGCLVLGALSWWLVRATGSRRRLLLGGATGFCGSLTTFSTFAVEVALLLRRTAPFSNVTFGATPVRTAFVYVAVSLIGGAATFILGRTLARRLEPR